MSNCDKESWMKAKTADCFWEPNLRDVCPVCVFVKLRQDGYVVLVPFLCYAGGMETTTLHPTDRDDRGMTAQAGVWCGFFSLILLLFASLGWYVFPIADDHSYFLQFGELNYWDVAKQVYFTGSGRYLSTFFLTFLSGYTDNLVLYHAYALILIVMLTASLFFLVTSCHRGRMVDALTMTLCLTVAFIAGMPSPSQGLYWMSGAFTFFPAFVATFIVIGAFCCMAFFPEKKPWPFVALAVAGLFVCMGCNELTAAACMFFLVLAYGVAHISGHSRRRLFGFLVLWGFVLLCFSFSAPGNFARTDAMHRPWEWRFMFNVAGGMFEGFKWFFRSPVIPAVLFCAVLLQPRWDATVTRCSATKRLVFWALLACALFFGEFLLVYVSSRRAPYARMNNAIFHAAFTFALFGGALMQDTIQRILRTGYTRMGKKVVFFCAGALLTVSIVFQPSVRASIRNYVNGEFAAYRATWLTRLAMLPPKDRAEGVVLTVPALRSRPFPIAFRDLEESQEKHQWIKNAFTAYHGLRCVVVEPREGGGSDEPFDD